mgnify:CR=1 FL=1
MEKYSLNDKLGKSMKPFIEILYFFSPLLMNSSSLIEELFSIFSYSFFMFENFEGIMWLLFSKKICKMDLTFLNHNNLILLYRIH